MVVIETPEKPSERESDDRPTSLQRCELPRSGRGIFHAQFTDLPGIPNVTTVTFGKKESA